MNWPPPGKRHLTRKDFPYRKGPNGRWLCRLCGREAPRPRMTFCGDTCLRRYLEVKYPEDALLRVESKVCGLCGLDCGLLGEALEYARLFMVALNPGGFWRAEHWYSEILVDLGFPPLRPRRRLFDIDHIVPLAEGGRHVRKNLRIVCIPCHRGETTALQRRLSKTQRLRRAHEEHQTAMRAGQLEFMGA